MKQPTNRSRRNRVKEEGKEVGSKRKTLKSRNPPKKTPRRKSMFILDGRIERRPHNMRKEGKGKAGRKV